MFGPYPTTPKREAVRPRGIDPDLYRYLRSEFRGGTTLEALLSDSSVRTVRRRVAARAARTRTRPGVVRFVVTAMLDFLRPGMRATRPRRGAKQVPSDRR